MKQHISETFQLLLSKLKEPLDEKTQKEIRHFRLEVEAYLEANISICETLSTQKRHHEQLAREYETLRTWCDTQLKKGALYESSPTHVSE